MNLNKFTEKAQEAVLASQQLASELNHAQLEPEHLLVTLLEQPEGVVPTVLQKLNADPVGLARAGRRSGSDPSAPHSIPGGSRLGNSQIRRDPFARNDFRLEGDPRTAVSSRGGRATAGAAASRG